MTLGQRIQAGRTALGLSQEALGERVGVTRQAVSKWEADAALPDTDKLIALSRLFGMTLNELLQVEEPPAGEGDRGPAERQRPGGNKRAALGAAVVLLALALFLPWVGLFRLEGRLSALEAQVDALGDQTAWTPPQVEDLTFYAANNGAGTTSLSLDLIPQSIPEDLTVRFSAVPASGKTVTAEGRREEGGHYTAQMTMADAFPPITVSVVFSGKEGTEYPAALVRIIGVGRGGCSWESLWKDE